MNDKEFDLNVYNFNSIQEDDEFKKQNLNFSKQNVPSAELPPNMNLNDFNMDQIPENDDLGPNYPNDQSYENYPNYPNEMGHNENQNETRTSVRETNEEDENSVSSYVGSDLTPEEEETKKKILLFIP